MSNDKLTPCVINYQRYNDSLYKKQQKQKMFYDRDKNVIEMVVGKPKNNLNLVHMYIRWRLILPKSLLEIVPFPERVIETTSGDETEL